MAQTWISGNNSDSSRWHLARKHELRGEKTGNVMSTHLVAACTGKQLGGAWGYSSMSYASMPLVPDHLICKRCAALAGNP